MKPVFCSELLPLSSGFQAQVFVTRDRLRVVKVIGLNEADFMNQHQATQLAEQVGIYQQMCQTVGLRVPAQFTCRAEFDPQLDRWLVVEEEAYSGKAFDQWVADQTDQVVLTVADQLIDQILIAFSTLDENRRLTIGIDPKVANFTVGNQQLVTYIDFVPARYRINGDYLVEYLGPITEREKRFFINRYFTRNSVVKILLIQFSRVCPRLRRPFLERLIDRLTAAGQTAVVEMLTSSLSFQFFRTRDTGLIEQLNPTDPDGIRDFACEVAIANGHLNTETFSQIFSLTHLDVRESHQIQPGSFCTIKQLLHSMAPARR